MDATPEAVPHIAPLPAREWDPAMFEALQLMKPPEGSTYAKRQQDREQGGARAVGVFDVLANHPELTRGFLAFNRHLLYFSTLSERDRELAVLRVAFRRRCAYEWAQHVPVAHSVGISDVEVKRVAEGPDAPGWSAADAAVIRAVDELQGDGVVSEATWQQLAATLDTKQLMDLVFTIGGYDTLALAFNSFGLELDPDLARYPLPGDTSS